MSTCGNCDHYNNGKINPASDLDIEDPRWRIPIPQNEGSTKRIRVAKGGAYEDINPLIKTPVVFSSWFPRTSEEAATTILTSDLSFV